MTLSSGYAGRDNLRSRHTWKPPRVDDSAPLRHLTSLAGRVRPWYDLRGARQGPRSAL
ncbi:hypothetical protein HanXRQr2_Chr16g0735561 [Helianthus annuus]|uniref:Uncharacterized protein n=1 Tax=Helianthus annuus TaxID=4232 RepID=A0A251RY18_HELAN|nr:hypothetical protein HanXRQr2_Chr16g0735561 [Helianthus annuus]KAJ0437246.1 hypothetical protein HanHA300_Chr16g0599841 [Helianthus annuus]KAJ0459555.1 hypothetical protein HanHA89_Chr16g0650291 [Helianthus annuus]